MPNAIQWKWNATTAFSCFFPFSRFRPLPLLPSFDVGQPSAAPAALPAPTLPDLSMALVPIGGQLAKVRPAVQHSLCFIGFFIALVVLQFCNLFSLCNLWFVEGDLGGFSCVAKGTRNQCHVARCMADVLGSHIFIQVQSVSDAFQLQFPHSAICASLEWELVMALVAQQGS